MIEKYRKTYYRPTTSDLNSQAAGIDQVCTLKHALAITVKPSKFSSRHGRWLMN